MSRFLIIVSLVAFSVVFNAQSQLILDDIKPNYASALDEISLFNHDSTIFRLDTYRNKQLTVYIFLGHQCPICQKYGHKLRTFYQQFKEQNIDLIGIVPLRDVELPTIAEYAALYDFEFPVLSDKQRVLTDVFGATVTPEIVVVDNKGTQIYRGMIDNWFYALGKYRRVTTEYYLQDALHSYLEGSEITVKETDPIGCFINMTSYQTN
ncbi:MAG: redoxin domain-containing protein [Cyclobacteriaceae bacterium]